MSIAQLILILVLHYILYIL